MCAETWWSFRWVGCTEKYFAVLNVLKLKLVHSLGCSSLMWWWSGFVWWCADGRGQEGRTQDSAQAAPANQPWWKWVSRDPSLPSSSSSSSTAWKVKVFCLPKNSLIIMMTCSVFINILIVNDTALPPEYWCLECYAPIMLKPKMSCLIFQN